MQGELQKTVTFDSKKKFWELISFKNTKMFYTAPSEKKQWSEIKKRD
jgi:hypothetical protein